MATLYTEIYDPYFLDKFTDYNLDSLYQTNPPAWSTQLKAHLITAIPRFKHPKQDISKNNRDDVAGQFNADLTEAEKSILAGLMLIAWKRKNINNIISMNLNLGDNDFKHYAEANNLEKKQASIVFEIEDNSNEQNDYGLNQAPWEEWAAGNYDGDL